MKNEAGIIQEAGINHEETKKRRGINIISWTFAPETQERTETERTLHTNTINPSFLRFFVVSFLLILSGASLAFADSPRSSAAKGIKHYNSEEYDKALTEFMAGLDKSPDKPELSYDLGAALYRLQQYPQAADAFNKAAAKKNPKVAGDAWFNLGNSLYNAQKYDDAVKAYKNSLVLNHEDKDAKHNLEMALRMKQVQQQQQQSGQDSSGQKQQQKQQQQKGDQKQQEAKAQQQKQQQDQQGDQKKDQKDKQMAEQDSSRTPPDSTKEQQMTQKGPMTKEEALQLLQAMEGDEQDAQKQKLIRQFGEPKHVSKDW